MPRGRGTFTLLGSSLAVMVAYLGWSAVHSASSAPIPHDPAPVSHAQVLTPRVTLSVAPARRVYRVAFLGDSVSVGFGASARSRTYVADVSRWLEKHGKRVVATVDAKGGVPVAYWEWARIPKRLDAAVVELGTNDVRLGTPPERFAQEYRTLTSRIRAAAPRARLLCLSVWSNPVAAGPDRVVNAQIRAVCPGTYVDITGIRRLPHIRSSDGFHPNDTGYRLIAQAIESKLKPS